MFVVLGGSGFIGTNLRNRLVELHIHSTLVSRGTEAMCGTPAPGDSFIALNEFEGPAGDKLIKEASVIVYLAGASVPSTFADEPWRDIDANISLAARTFWRVAQINPTAKIIYLSSGGTIYGDQPGMLTSEKTLAEPKSGYGLSKLLIEEALRFVGRVTGASYAILRVSNPIGPHQTNKAQGIVSLALRAALEGGVIKLFDEGRQVRDYIDVRDVVDSIIAASETEIGQGTWNIGSGMGRSTAEMIKIVEETTQRKVCIELHPKRLVDVSYIVLDISLAREELNWSPSRPISDAVESAYRWLIPKIESGWNAAPPRA